MMMVLVFIHVMSAVLGLGPAYAFPLLLRTPSTLGEMEHNLGQVARLELFPKIFGTVAILSGLALFWLGSYGPFQQLWILGTLAVYVLIEVLVVGFMNPAASKLHREVKQLKESGPSGVPDQGQLRLYGRVRSLHSWSCLLGLVIFLLMIVKP